MDDPYNKGLQGWEFWRGYPNERTLGSASSPIFPPRPDDNEGWRNAPGLIAPAIESGLCQFVDGAALVVDESRADQLRCCGNGVVPLQAACALTELLRRIGA